MLTFPLNCYFFFSTTLFYFFQLSIYRFSRNYFFFLLFFSSSLIFHFLFAQIMATIFFCTSLRFFKEFSSKGQKKSQSIRFFTALLLFELNDEAIDQLINHLWLAGFVRQMFPSHNSALRLKFDLSLTNRSLKSGQSPILFELKFIFQFRRRKSDFHLITRT